MFDGLILVEKYCFHFFLIVLKIDIIHYKFEENNNNEISRPLC